MIAKTGFAVEVAGNSTAKGSTIQAGALNHTPNEFWELVPANGPQNSYYIKSFCGQCLDVSQNKAESGQPVIQWDYNGGKNQIWIITPA